MDWTNLKAYIGKETTDDDNFIEGCFDHAVILVTQATADAFRPIPQGIMDEMVLEVGNELYNRKNAPSGQSMYATFDGGSMPVRAPRDPLTMVRPIIAMYVVPL